MSAHVVPKVAAFAEDEDEKTTIESGWEEEPSTTVEQGEVADKIRALGLPRGPNNITNVTSTNAGMLDEPTVDDRHGNMSPPSPVMAPTLRARLLITHGNDTGQSLEVQPGKSYTIGRAIDNDFVLTDIAVSRKHFDLRHEGGSWVLVDRGSGNGTVVNGQIEDQPFMLANGDVIEIGNTTFRFEQPQVSAAAAARNKTPAPTFDVDLDEEEPSTVAGKPVRDELPMLPTAPTPQRSRPKTQPPPAPLAKPRAASSSMPPPFGSGVPVAPRPLSQSQLQPQRSPTMPPPMSMAGSMPSLGNVLTTIPGQAPPPQPQMLGMAPQYPVASVGQLHQMQLDARSMGPRDPTNGHLASSSYNSLPPQQPPAASYQLTGPLLTRRMKLVIGGAALTLFAAVATVAIIGGDERKPTAAATPDTAGSGKPAIDAIKRSVEAPPEPKVEPKLEKKPDVAVVEKKPEPKEAKVEPTIPEKKPEPKPEVARVVEKKPEPKLEKKPEPKPEIARVVEKKPESREPKEPKEKPAKKGDFAAAKSKADALYRNKKFNEAAAALKAAASSAADDEARELKSLAGAYESLGKSYFVGMAPGTKKTEAFTALQRAQNFDRSAGGAHADEIKTKLGQIAPQAAISLFSTKNYEAAFQAVRIAESLGGRGNDTKTVRDALEGAAGKLYAEAAKEIDSNPDGAKSKLRQIKGMVDSSSPWYGKANKLLSSG